MFHHPTIVNASIKRNIFLYDKGDYESYRNLLSVVDWGGIFLVYYIYYEFSEIFPIVQ
jgi:hypothetical protein